jgi:dihydroorotase
VVDLNLNWTVDETKLRSRSKNSPQEDRTLEGRVIETVVAGRTIYAYAR